MRERLLYVSHEPLPIRLRISAGAFSNFIHWRCRSNGRTYRSLSGIARAITARTGMDRAFLTCAR